MPVKLVNTAAAPCAISVIPSENTTKAAATPNKPALKTIKPAPATAAATPNRPNINTNPVSLPRSKASQLIVVNFSNASTKVLTPLAIGCIETANVAMVATKAATPIITPTPANLPSNDITTIAAVNTVKTASKPFAFSLYWFQS